MRSSRTPSSSQSGVGDADAGLVGEPELVQVGLVPATEGGVGGVGQVGERVARRGYERPARSRPQPVGAPPSISSTVIDHHVLTIDAIPR